MNLSQARTRAVLDYSLNIPRIKKSSKWMIKYLSANGMSSSKIILDENGKEDKKRSKRVDFKVKPRKKNSFQSNRKIAETKKAFK